MTVDSLSRGVTTNGTGLYAKSDNPIGKNYRGYSVSHDFRVNTWLSQLLTDNLAISARLENRWLTNFNGADPQSPNGVISTNVESFRGGYTLNLGLGVMALYEGHLLNVELVPRLYQDVNGIQLETDWSLIASWSKGF